MSKIVFPASVLPVPEDVRTQVKTMLFNYLWKGKRDKVKRSSVVSDVKNGGIKMLDIDAFFMSLKAAWVTKLINCEGKWSSLFHMVNEKLYFPSNYIWKITVRNIEDFPVLKCFPLFYQDVVLAFNFSKYIKPLEFVNRYDALNEPLWGNTYFKRGGKCLHFKNWLRKGIYYVKNIIGEDGKFLKDEAMFTILGNKGNTMGEIVTVKKHIFRLLKQLDLSSAKYTKIQEIPSLIFQNKRYHIINQKSKFFYNIIVNKKCSRSNMESIYARNFNFPNVKSTWDNIYLQKISSLKVNFLKDFNFKILNNILPSGYWLSKWNHNVNSKCDHCGETESVEHMLYSCIRIKEIWSLISFALNCNITWKNIVCGWPSYVIDNKILCYNLIISIVSNTIFRTNSKCKFDMRNYGTVNIKRNVCETIYYYISIQDDVNLTDLFIIFCDKILQLLL